MNKVLENNKQKTFSLLPLRHGFIPRYMHIDTQALNSLTSKDSRGQDYRILTSKTKKTKKEAFIRGNSNESKDKTVDENRLGGKDDNNLVKKENDKTNENEESAGKKKKRCRGKNNSDEARQIKDVLWYAFFGGLHRLF